MAEMIPLSEPDITRLEIDAVVEVLQTPTLSIGPLLEDFESVAQHCRAAAWDWRVFGDGGVASGDAGGGSGERR